MKLMRIKLFPKFALIMILISVIPLSIIGLRMIDLNRIGLQGAILELHINLVSSLAEKIDDYITNLNSKLIQVIRSLEMREMGWAERQTVLQSLLEANPDIINISVADQEGNELLKVYNPDLEKEPELINRAEEPLFQEVKAKRQTQISPLSYREDLPRLEVAYLLGERYFLFTNFSLEKLKQKILNTRIGKTGYAYLVDKEGKIIIHPEKEKIFSSAKNVPLVSEAISRQVLGSREFKDESGEEIIGAYSPVKNLTWAVIIQQAKKEAYSSVLQMQKQAQIWILILVIIAGVAAFFLASNLTRPIIALIRGAEKVALGDFGVKVNVQTRDELRQLADTFNFMTEKLKEYADMQIDKILTEKTKTETIVFSIADGIIFTDHKGKIQLVNPQAENIFRLPKGGWEDKTIWDYLSPTLGKEIFDLINQPEKSFFKEVALPLTEEQKKYFEVRGKLIYTPKGEEFGLLTVFHDVTLEKEIERMKDDFTHSITHDLRNPLTSIRSLIKFLSGETSGPLNEKQKKMLKTMEIASYQLLTLINNILDVAKMETGGMPFELSLVNLKEIAEKVLRIEEPLLKGKNLSLEFILVNEIPPINADVQLIERLFGNLIGNAIKFTPENGKIWVKIEDLPERIQVEVVDGGPGIPEEYLEKIFDKFQQLERAKGGTGLGLTICKYITEAHGGKIWVESKLGEGSKFIFWLPKTQTQIAAHLNGGSPKR